MSKYQRWYNQLISTRKNRKVEEYAERHHILPKSLGGSDDPSNIINLLPREHFIAHLLLARIHSGTAGMKMVHALRRMLTGHKGYRYIPNSRTYAVIRSLSMQKCSGENNPMWGKRGDLHPLYGKWDEHWTEERRAKISATSKGRLWTEEQRKKQYESRVKKWADEDYRKKMSALRKGKPKSEEHRKKIGEANKGRVVSEETRKLLSEAANRRYKKVL